MPVIEERVSTLEQVLEKFITNVGIEFNKLYNSQMRTESELRGFKDEVSVFKDEMKDFKDEMLAFKDEMKNFKDEMLVFKDEMKDFKDEMLAFKDEMKDFKDEMLAFKDEMKDFKDEMLAFKDEMKDFKEEMLVFKDEMKDFKDEMLVFKDGMKDFKDEMLAFKNEMKDFKDEMLVFKDEMKDFKDEMLVFKDEMKDFKDEMLAFKDEMRTFKDDTTAFKEEAREQNKKMNLRWGEIANKLGTFVEDIVAPSIPRIIQEEFGLEIESFGVRIKRRLKDGRMKEYDTIATAGSYIFLNFTRSTLESSDVKDFIEEIMAFRNFFPEYKDKKIIGILASSSINENVLTYAEKCGLLVLAIGDSLMEIKNTKGFKPKEW